MFMCIYTREFGPMVSRKSEVIFITMCVVVYAFNFGTNEIVAGG